MYAQNSVLRKQKGIKMRIKVTGYDCSDEEALEIIKKNSCISSYPVTEIEIENNSVVFILGICGLTAVKVMCGTCNDFCHEILDLFGRPPGFKINFPKLNVSCGPHDKKP